MSVGGASRIRHHFLQHNPVLGVKKCGAPEKEIELVVKELRELLEQEAEKQEHAAKKRQLDRTTAGAASQYSSGAGLWASMGRATCPQQGVPCAPA
eukprot:scaffold139219_cov24-Tisochrysis_lutea.AAC.3